jgi:hypothetical protein
VIGYPRAMRAHWLLLLLVGCGHGPSREAEPPQAAVADAAPAPTCAQAVARMNQAGLHQLERGGADAELLATARADAERITPRLIQACADDAWSAELVACLVERPIEELGGCEPLVTPAQMESVIRLRQQAEAERPAP